MPQIRFTNVAFGYINNLFKNVTLTIGPRDRIGIVGNNGCGKSTLLACIAGLVELQAGKISVPKGLKFGFIEQEVSKSLANKSLFELLSDAIPVQERDYSLWKVDHTLDTFKAPEAIRSRSMKDLSGGWQRLALIARTVLSTPDVLLLDEPTNHLDIEKILLLERWLNEQVYDIPLISVSHDRRFLANCTNKTLFLRDMDIREYNYSYVRATQLLNEADETSAVQRSKELKEMTRLKRSAHELRQIGVNNYSAAALKKSNQIAKRAESIEKTLTSVHVHEKRALTLNNSSTHIKRLVGLHGVDISTPTGEFLFHIAKLDMMRGERLVIFGANGSGKSQLLKTLYQAMFDVEASKRAGISIPPAIKPAYLDQHMSHLPLNRHVYDYLSETLSLGNQQTTTLLIRAGFPVAIHKTTLDALSPGQRARVAFLVLHHLEPNFYIMDEPTNHLDIAGQEQLESELLEQHATSLIVSHDRAFTQNVGTKFYMIERQQLVLIDSPDVYYARYDESKNQDGLGTRLK